jgi:uncharacterized damage-inducible protein DinB
MHDDFAALFAYNRWADDRILTACRGLSQEAYTRELPGGMTPLRATLVHVAGATQAWSRRLRGETVTALASDAELPTVEDAVRVLNETHDAFAHFASTLTPQRLAGIFAYRNLKNEEKRLPLWAVLRHVVNHASYHRGQVAVKLKRLGVDPPATDLVFWAIEQTAREGQKA